MSRETSNKALNAINQINLVPFLMSFLAARAKLPIATVTAAGALISVLSSAFYALICLSAMPIRLDR